MEIDKEELRRRFPYIAMELEGQDNKVPISSFRSDNEAAERAISGKFRGYNPDVIDFIRRCDTEEQAREIIEYLEERHEVSHEYAVRLREQLRKKGVRIFGSKKENDYYLKQDGY